MNYLELTKMLRQECGIPGNGPSSVVGQTGEAARLATYINDAWLELQGMYDNWGWMRLPFSYQTVAEQGDYAPATTINGVTGLPLTDLRYWWKETVRGYRTDIGIYDEQWLVEWEYQVFRNTYRYNAQVSGRPVVFAIHPTEKAMMLGQVPNAVFTMVGEYQRLPSSMTVDADLPTGLPTHLHKILVYKAMQFYALFEAAPEVLSRGQRGEASLMAQLEREWLPEVSLGNPLA